MNANAWWLTLLAMVFWCTESSAGFCNNGVDCQCVDYCKDNGWSSFDKAGNAKEWFTAAAGRDYATGKTPKKGAVLVLDSWEGLRPNPAGHVAIVQDIVSSSEIIVNHANWSPSGLMDETIHTEVSVRDVSSTGNWSRVSFYGSGNFVVLGFIYPKGISSSSDNICDYVTEQCDIRVQGDVGWFPAVSLCQGASEWFIIATDANGNKYPVASRPDASACPTACSPD